MPPVAKMVTFGREALMGVLTSWRTKSRCRSDRVRSMGDARVKHVRRGMSCVKAFILPVGTAL